MKRNFELSEEAFEALRSLSRTDRRLVAGALSATEHMVDEDQGDNHETRANAYRALAGIVWSLGQ